MKLLWLAIILGVSSCVTDDPCSHKAEDYLVKGIVEKYRCESEAVLSDVQSWVKANNFCEIDFTEDEYIEALPDGVWSDDGIKCYYLAKGFVSSTSEPAFEKWGCQLKDLVPFARVNFDCGSL